jgi:ferredoxin
MFAVVEQERVQVDGARCIGCGACSTLVPDIFTLCGGRASLVRQPESRVEQDRCAAALLICPSQAIGVRKANA